MGYSSRYHAASLAAVFLALAIGILIGVGFGSDIVSGTADDLEHGLESDLDDARGQVDDLQGELDRTRDFEGAVYPAIVGDQLRGQEIALVGLGGLAGGTANDVESAVDPAGATLSEVAVVREPPDLAELAGTAPVQVARSIERGDAEQLRLLGERAGRALVRGGFSFDSLRGTLLYRYSGRPGAIDGVVVVRDQPDDMSQDDQAATDAIETGLIRGLSQSAVTVGAETTGADPSSIEFFDDLGLPTVDSIDLVSGKVALVYALTGAASGNFGVKDSADSLLPELLSPEAEQESATTTSGQE